MKLIYSAQSEQEADGNVISATDLKRARATCSYRGVTTGVRCRHSRSLPARDSLGRSALCQLRWSRWDFGGGINLCSRWRFPRCLSRVPYLTGEGITDFSGQRRLQVRHWCKTNRDSWVWWLSVVTVGDSSSAVATLAEDLS